MMNMKRIFVASVTLTMGLFMQIASADTLGFRAGAGIWQAESSGTFRNGAGGTDIDLKDDLYLTDEDQSYTYMVLEHPFPIIPNIKVSQTALSSTGTGTPSGAFQFAGNSYSGAITSEMVLDHADITAYYQFLDNWINFDLGITARTFDGYLEVTDGTTISRTNIDKTIPMLYVAIGVQVPGIDLYFGTESNVISFDGQAITDITTKVSYTTGYMIGIEAGYRVMTIEFDDLGGNSSNMEFSGSFANLYFHF